MESRTQLRSEEVQEIISQIPGGLLRWGISLIFILFIVLLTSSWFIRYPDVINASMVVTTNPAPITLVSRASGKIHLLKKPNEAVRKYDIVATIQTNARYEDILRLERIISQITTQQDFAEALEVGELQSFLNNTKLAFQEWATFQNNELHQKQIVHLGKQIAFYKQLNQNLQNQLGLMKEETTLSHQQFKADSVLFSQRVIAALDFNKAKGNYLIQQRSLKSTEASIISNQLQIVALEKQLTEVEIEKNSKEGQLQINYTNSLNELAAQLKEWKENYLFTAPTDGTLAHLGFIENDQFVESNKQLFAVLPNSTKLIAKAEMPVAGAGKAKVGQVVNIRLDNYPFEQFGMLTGKIESISEIPEKERYSVLINLDNGMISTYNKKLNFTPHLQGEAEIITEDLRMLERIFYQIRKLANIR